MMKMLLLSLFSISAAFHIGAMRVERPSTCSLNRHCLAPNRHLPIVVASAPDETVAEEEGDHDVTSMATETTMDRPPPLPSIVQLENFIELVEKYPQLNCYKELGFFKEYLESLGATVDCPAGGGLDKELNFIELVKSEPERLQSKELVFFKEYLIKMGATIPSKPPQAAA